jgi:hypothetical protein
VPVDGDREEAEVSRWLRFTIVLAAAAFVVGFRFSADGNDADAGQLNAARASAVQSEAPAVVKQAEPVRLAQVVELPKLASEPATRVAARAKQAAEARKARAAERKAAAARKQRAAAKRKKAAAAKRRAAAAARKRAASSRPRVVVTPAPTAVRPAATPVYRAPAPSTQQNQGGGGGGYVGKDFDSEG